MLMLLAGLKSLSKVFMKALELMGANFIKKFIFITMPLITLAVTAILIKTIDVARSFDIIWNLTQGGPHFVRVMSTLCIKHS